jgi:hypothetical protein
VDEATTIIYTHVMRMDGSAANSPLGALTSAEIPQSCPWRTSAFSLERTFTAGMPMTVSGFFCIEHQVFATIRIKVQCIRN